MAWMGLIMMWLLVFFDAGGSVNALSRDDGELWSASCDRVIQGLGHEADIATASQALVSGLLRLYDELEYVPIAREYREMVGKGISVIIQVKASVGRE